MAVAADNKSTDAGNQKGAVKAGTGVNKRERTGLLRIFDWIIRPWHYFDTIPRAVAYLIAASGFYGGILFVVGSFAGCSPAVGPRHAPAPDCTVTFCHVDSDSLCLQMISMY